ncbi:MAG: PHP domain-containing protein [Promethearchaeota archaeon]
MDFPRLNLHIHSKYSDGRNSIKQIVRKSIEYKLKYIAMTDHFTNSWKAGIIPTLDSKEKIINYISEIKHCQNYLKREGIDLKVFTGIEIDISSSKSYILNLINPYEFDIILFEYLESPEGIAFIKTLLKSWKKKYLKNKSFPILGLAHFDPSLFIYGYYDVLIPFLKEFNIYYEFNSSYSQYYAYKFQDFFYKLKENNILVAIGCDSHNSADLMNIEEPFNKIRDYKLEKNLGILIENLESRED